jgi:low temperature requirement protein LtrA
MRSGSRPSAEQKAPSSATDEQEVSPLELLFDLVFVLSA